MTFHLREAIRLDQYNPERANLARALTESEMSYEANLAKALAESEETARKANLARALTEFERTYEANLAKALAESEETARKANLARALTETERTYEANLAWALAESEKIALDEQRRKTSRLHSIDPFAPFQPHEFTMDYDSEHTIYEQLAQVHERFELINKQESWLDKRLLQLENQLSKEKQKRKSFIKIAVVLTAIVTIIFAKLLF